MNKEKVWKQRKPSLWVRIKTVIVNLFWGWKTKHMMDMPRSQPCPQCGGWRPRQRIVIGAVYKCNKHGEFIVIKR